MDVILKDTKAFKEGFMPPQEYLEISSRRPLFMEFLMTVLPSREALQAFLATFSPPDQDQGARRRRRRADRWQ